MGGFYALLFSFIFFLRFCVWLGLLAYLSLFVCLFILFVCLLSLSSLALKRHHTFINSANIGSDIAYDVDRMIMF